MATIYFRNTEQDAMALWYRDLNGDDPGYEVHIPNLAGNGGTATSVDIVFIGEPPKADVVWRTYAPGKLPGSGDALQISPNHTVDVTLGQAKKKRS